MKKLIALLIISAATLTVASCKHGTVPVVPVPVTPPEPLPLPMPVTPPAVATEADRVVELVNAERAKYNLKAVKANAQLTAAAQRYADLMASRDYLDHFIEGDAGIRAKADGYRWRAIGENIAWNYRSAEQVMHGWMGSPDHRQNILEETFEHVGVGIASNEKGEPYHCQVFGSPARSELEEVAPQLVKTPTPLLPLFGKKPGPTIKYVYPGCETQVNQGKTTEGKTSSYTLKRK